MPVLIHAGIWMSFRQGRCFHQTNKADVPCRMSHMKNAAQRTKLQGGRDLKQQCLIAGDQDLRRLYHGVGDPDPPAHTLFVIELVEPCARSVSRRAAATAQWHDSRETSSL